MARKRTTVVSNFRAAKDAGHDAIKDAIKKAVDEGAERTRNRINQQANRRGYLLDSSTVFEEADAKDGRIMVGAADEFWWKFFEYGTTYIPAMPFLRPGHTRAKKVLRQVLEDDFEKFISRRARVRT